MEELKNWLLEEIQKAEKEKQFAQNTDKNKQLYSAEGKLFALKLVEDKINEIINPKIN